MSTHDGHRARLKERFLNEGLDSFSTHEVVELMLFYAIPQRDVNETAHLLVERFGSLAGILEADIDEIKEVEGVGAHAATMFKMICAVSPLIPPRLMRDTRACATPACFAVFFMLRHPPCSF